jgi:hypothetical protein
MTDCRLCETNKLTDPDRTTGICKECRARIGMLSELPPPRRPPLPCRKCQGLRFVRSFPREHVTADATSFWFRVETTGAVKTAAIPAAATYVPVVKELPRVGVVFFGNTVNLDLNQPRPEPQ